MDHLIFMKELGALANERNSDPLDSKFRMFAVMI